MQLVLLVLVLGHHLHGCQFVEQPERVQLRVGVVDKHVHEVGQRHVDPLD